MSILSKFVTIKYQNETWYFFTEITKFLGYKKNKLSIFTNESNFTKKEEGYKYLYEIKNYNKLIKTNNLIKKNSRIIVEWYLIEFLCYSKMLKAIDLLDEFKINYVDFKKILSPELTIFKSIQLYLVKTNIEYKFQKKCGKYFIDCYIYDYNIAIEIDEFGHRSYNKEKEIKREKFIIKELDCIILRCNPHSKKFNIFTFMGEIMQNILNRTDLNETSFSENVSEDVSDD